MTTICLWTNCALRLLHCTGLATNPSGSDSRELCESPRERREGKPFGVDPNPSGRRVRALPESWSSLSAGKPPETVPKRDGNDSIWFDETSSTVSLARLPETDPRFLGRRVRAFLSTFISVEEGIWWDHGAYSSVSPCSGLGSEIEKGRGREERPGDANLQLRCFKLVPNSSPSLVRLHPVAFTYTRCSPTVQVMRW